MVEHIVIFKIRKETAADKVNEMTEALNGLKKKIPQLIEMHAGINFSPRNKDYGVILVSRFKNKADPEQNQRQCRGSNGEGLHL